MEPEDIKTFKMITMFNPLPYRDQSDWPNYRVGMWAPGWYGRRCIRCNQEMLSDKRAAHCYPCAKASIEDAITNNLGAGI